MYDWLNIEVAKAAVVLAEADDMVQAEELLVRHYSGDQVATELRALMGVQAFRPRMRLAELALVDYRHGRYHACAPVVLALLDGMVNELENQGFFSQNVDLTAWDCIAAYDGGLNELKSLLFKVRSKTTMSPIELPCRNGILHGMDLAYDTQLVAAKCWAALFATADWARRVEQGKKEAPLLDAEPTWNDVLKKVRQNDEENERLAQWKPRASFSSAETDPFPTDSPEAALIEFLDAWKNKRYGIMAKRSDPFSKSTLNARAGQMREYYRELPLRAFTIESRSDIAPAITEIVVRGIGTQDGQKFDLCGTFRLVHFNAQRNPVVYGNPDGTWFVMNWNPWQQSTVMAES